MGERNRNASSAEGGIADLLASYRKRVKRAFRLRMPRDATHATGTAVANSGDTADESAQARQPRSQTPEGENS